MYAYQFAADGAAFRLHRVELPTREPGPGEVRIRVRATSLNYRDLIALRNKAGRKVEGIIPLSDGAGEVLAIGDGVTQFQPGDHVAGCFFRDWQSGPFDLRYHQADLGGSIHGMLAEEVILPEHGVVATPPHLSFEEAACLPCAGLTAWYALTKRGGLATGETVLALGTGGVSIFALQFAVASGAKMFITSSSDAKLARARELGAAETINYKSTPDWEKEVWKRTDKRGIDHVIEVGGPGTLEKSLGCVAAGGQIALIGVLTGFGPTSASLFPLMARNARIDGIYVGPRDEFMQMNAFLAAHAIHPIIDRSFAFDEAAAAFEYLESGSHFGKVVVRV